MTNSFIIPETVKYSGKLNRNNILIHNYSNNRNIIFCNKNCILLHIFLCICFDFCCIGRRGRRGRDRILVGFTTTYVINAYHHYRCGF